MGEHRGGYGAFIFEITDLVKYGEQNPVLVRVNNGEQLDVMPLVGDFNFTGAFIGMFICWLWKRFVFLP